MEIYRIENVSFAYPNQSGNVLENINLNISSGEFITICGKSGCGKTTLLRLLKPSVAPFGSMTGTIIFDGTPLSEVDTLTQVTDIGFVMQNPDNQIVTDKVWHELAFGLESLGYTTNQIRARVSEIASFFGIENWFYKKTNNLSGGQKQLLNLASVMVMQPKVLILDEPTSQLDPIAASEFLKTLQKINDELGTTIILTEHRLEDALAMSHRVVVMDNGEVIADDTPRSIGSILKGLNHDMYEAMPAPIRVYGSVASDEACPLTIREGKNWLSDFCDTHDTIKHIAYDESVSENSRPLIEVRDAYFRYSKELPDVIKGLSFTVSAGETLAVLGGNGTGKTTAVSLISGLRSPQRGDIYIDGRRMCEIPDLYNGLIGVLPQNPTSLFTRKTVYLDLYDMTDKKLPKEEREQQVMNISQLCGISKLMDNHPYDLSGGEQQRTALAMVLLRHPRILIMDEPTKGMDAQFKKSFAQILYNLKASGTAIMMVSHDVEFCAQYADRCAMFFDGSITSVDTPRKFFNGNSFYTTSANRMSRNIISDAILVDDIVYAIGGECSSKENQNTVIYKPSIPLEEKSQKKHKLSIPKIVSGIIFLMLFIASWIIRNEFIESYTTVYYISQAASIALAFLTLWCLIPHKDLGISVIHTPRSERSLTRRSLVATILILILIPLTIYFGIYYLSDRKYYFISLLIILETILPFGMIFESRKPQARELVIISVLCALGVAGRTAFFMVPEFKPVIALVIISGICFGGETGFLVGAVTAFVSNFYFGQGPWTPWQMFAFGIVGFLAGILFKKGLLRRNKLSLIVFGFTVTLIVYGGIMNPASVIMMTNKPTWDMIKASFVMGFPIDIIHALSTAFFLWVMSEPMIEKLERIKVKYGLIEK